MTLLHGGKKALLNPYAYTGEDDEDVQEASPEERAWIHRMIAFFTPENRAAAESAMAQDGIPALGALKGYDPEEERDQSGKWTAGGDGSTPIMDTMALRRSFQPDELQFKHDLVAYRDQFMQKYAGQDPHRPITLAMQAASDDPHGSPEGQRLYSNLMAAADHDGIDVKNGMTDYGISGTTSGESITLDETMPQGSDYQAGVLAHEMAHAEMNLGVGQVNLSLEELTAGLTATIVSHYAGVSRTPDEYPYFIAQSAIALGLDTVPTAQDMIGLVNEVSGPASRRAAAIIQAMPKERLKALVAPTPAGTGERGASIQVTPLGNGRVAIRLLRSFCGNAPLHATKAYDPSEARDEGGRWTAGGATDVADRETSRTMREQTTRAVSAASHGALSPGEVGDIFFGWLKGSETASSVAVEVSASQRFGQGMTDSLRERIAYASRYGGAAYEAALKNAPAFVNAQYEVTQRDLAKQGIDQMTLYRGVAYPAGQTPSEVADGGSTTLGDGITSWTLSQSEASRFAQTIGPGRIEGPSEGYVLTTTVPRDRIFSSGWTGLGDSTEAEVVLTGGPATLHSRRVV